MSRFEENEAFYTGCTKTAARADSLRRQSNKLDLDDGCTISIDRLKTGVLKRLDAAEESVTKHQKLALQTLAFERMKKEACVILHRIQEAEVEDVKRRKHNKFMSSKELTLAAFGLACLSFPGLLLFNYFFAEFFKKYEPILGLAAQEYSLLGSAARFCVAIMDVSEVASRWNRGSRIYLSLCIVLITCILLLMRFTVNRLVVRSGQHLQVLRAVTYFVKEEVQRRKRKTTKAKSTLP